MKNVARTLLSGFGPALVRHCSRSRSLIFGKFSPQSEDTSPTGIAKPRNGFRFRPARYCMSAVALATLLGGFLVYIRSAAAQAPPLTLELLAEAFTPDHRVRINTKGPSDVLQTKIVVQPGGDTGWHTHPGPVIVVVKTGAATEFHDNGCVSVHPAGSVFFESEGEVHRVVNESSEPAEAYATFIIPHGSQPLQPAADPGNTVCRPDPGDGSGQ